RPFTMDDHEEVLNLWASTGAEHSPAGRDSREHIEREISRPTSIFIVAEADGRIVGTVFGTHDGRKGWINRLVVHPAWRRRGIATRLVREVEERLEGMGIEIVAALIWKWNRVSRLVFERMGYVLAEDCLYYSKRRHRDV
ncbi:MAG TPA: GNAT family N-acetyltransferase, partial [Thermoplasmata archaeon]|nr:GNAT family N-acetyltransferase [Thermoplasmata archaeon]